MNINSSSIEDSLSKINATIVTLKDEINSIEICERYHHRKMEIYQKRKAKGLSYDALDLVQTKKHLVSLKREWLSYGDALRAANDTRDHLRSASASLKRTNRFLAKIS